MSRSRRWTGCLALVCAFLTTYAAAGAVRPAQQQRSDAAAAVPAQQLNSNSTRAIPFWPGRDKITVCVSEYTPMVYCNGRAPQAYSGYEVELFRRAATILGWDPGMLQWRCVNNWTELIDHLKAGDGACDVTPSGVKMDSSRLAAGIVFTRPTHRSGLAILVKNVHRVNGIWKFWDAFDWVVWIATLLTCVALAALVWAIDNLYWRFSIQRFSKDPLVSSQPSRHQLESSEEMKKEYAFERYFWESLTRPALTRDYYSYTFAGNLLQTAWGFALLIIFALYIGQTSADLTALTLSTGGIDGVDSLVGKSVGTSEEYVNKLAARSIAAVGYTWETVADEDAMIDKLKSGSIKALVLDSPMVSLRAAGDCELSMAGEAFSIFDAGVAFPANFSNAALLKAYNNALIALEDGRAYEELEQQFVTPPPSECAELSTTAVGFQQVAGLWVLLALSIATAIAWLLIVKLFENRVAARRRKKEVL